MKVLLRLNDNNQPIGWSMQPETDDDKRTINAIRDLSFFGMDDTHIKYDGRTNGDNKNAGTLKWVQKKYQKH